jgi:hypothetical protein
VRRDYESPRIGEIGLTGSASAAASAVYDAPGSRARVADALRAIAIGANAADFKFMKTNEKRYTEKT